MAVLRLEFVTAYFSDAVVGGFSTGAAFHVFVSQLKDFFGLSHLPHRSGAGNFFLKLYDICVNIPQQFNYFVMLVSAAALTFLLLGKNVITPFVKKRVKLVVPIPFELILVRLVFNFFYYRNSLAGSCHRSLSHLPLPFSAWSRYRWTIT